jgi:hypothetical protein
MKQTLLDVSVTDNHQEIERKFSPSEADTTPQDQGWRILGIKSIPKPIEVWVSLLHEAQESGVRYGKVVGQGSLELAILL